MVCKSAEDPGGQLETDHLNTPRLVADATGTTVWRWDQAEPFGNNPAEENPSGLGAFDLPLRLPGQRYDAETGLHYNYFRDYDPSIGRYGESDPVGLSGGLNTYAYVGATPLTRIDRLGLFDATGWGTGASTATGTSAATVAACAVGVVLMAIPGNVGQSQAACADDPQKKRTECKDKDDKDDCTKASKYQLKSAGITDEHEFKTDWGAVPNSRFDICACKDGSIVIKATGQCGRSGPSIPTDRRWK